MRGTLALSVFIATTILVVAAFFSYAFFTAYRAPTPLAQTVYFVIEPGQGVSWIAGEMGKDGIIKDPLVFKLAARLSGTQKSIKAGEYKFTPGMSVEDILHMVEKGETYQRQITFAEGLTSWQIVQALNAAYGLKGEITDIPADGTLLPETYFYSYGENRADKIKTMQSAMTGYLDKLWPDRKPNLPFTRKEDALILASIVEKETGVAAERPKIAGVFINRLRRGMKLQSDPTVIYALTKGEIRTDGQGPLGRRLLKKDLETDSPYNTYKYAGLPPAPIANPGKDAIKAVLMPEESDDLYFVADGTGGHVFARTLAEHNDNVVKWRKIRKNLQK